MDDHSLQQLFNTIDSMDAKRWAAFLTEDAIFRFGNMPAVIGRAQIQEFVATFFSSIAGLRHHLIKTWRDGTSVVMQGEVTYYRKDKKTVTVPFANVFELKNNLIKEYLVFVDAGPLYA